MGLGIQTNKSTASADAIDYTPATDDDTEVSQSGEPVDVAGDEYTDEPLTNDEGSGTSLLRQLAGPEFDDPFASPQARDNGVATDGDVEPDGEVATDGDVEPDGEVATDGDVEPDGEVATDGDVEPDGEVATDGDVEPDGEVATDGDVEMDADREPGAGSAVGPADGGLAPSVEAPGLNAGQLGNFNATTEAINESGLEGEAADKALLLLTASGLENNFSNLTGASHQLREGTTGLFNLPAENSMGPLSSEERNDVSSALDGLLDNERSGSLANLASDADVGLGQLSDQLKIGSDNRAVYGEAIDFLAETGAVSPERVENLRGIVAADETLTDKSWEVASFSTNPSETYDYWANDYSPSVGKGFDGWRENRQDYHNGLDLMGGNEPVQSAFSNGTVVSTEAWGSGTFDAGSQSNSNAVRVEYELPNSDETFLVDYGHMQNNGTLNVEVGDSLEAGERVGITSFNDGWSRGGHLDVKIRIPDSRTSEFAAGDTRATGGGRSFVDVQAFMRWYTDQTP